MRVTPQGGPQKGGPEASASLVYGAPFVKILYLTDLAQKPLSLHIFSYLCTHLDISAQR